MKYKLLSIFSLFMIFLLSSCSFYKQPTVNSKQELSKSRYGTTDTFSISGNLLNASLLTYHGELKRASELYFEILNKNYADNFFTKKASKLEFYRLALSTFVNAQDKQKAILVAKKILVIEPYDILSNFVINTSKDDKEVCKVSDFLYKKQSSDVDLSLMEFVNSNINAWCQYVIKHNYQEAKIRFEKLSNLKYLGFYPHSEGVILQILNSQKNRDKILTASKIKYNMDIWQVRFMNLMNDGKLDNDLLEKFKDNIQGLGEFKEKQVKQSLRLASTKHKLKMDDFIAMSYLEIAKHFYLRNSYYLASLFATLSNWQSNNQYCTASIVLSLSSSKMYGLYNDSKVDFLNNISSNDYCYWQAQMLIYNSHIHNKEFEAAQNVLDNLKNYDFDIYDIMKLEGLLYFKQKKYDKAISLYKDLLQYIKVVVKTNKVKSESISKVIYSNHLLNNEALINFYLGILYYKMKQKDLSYSYFKKAISLEPDNDHFLNYVGYNYINNADDVEKGISLVKKALKIKPNDPYYMDSLGWGYYKKGMIEKAIVYLGKARKLSPSNVEILSHFGDANWQIGRQTEAIVVWRRAIMELTLNPEAQDNYGSEFSIKSFQNKIDNGLEDDKTD